MMGIGWFMQILSPSVTEVIPIKTLKENVSCGFESYTITVDGSHKISTIHSDEEGLAAKTTSRPFTKAVTFTDSDSYGFGDSDEESTSVSYQFELKRGDTRYIGIVNAQISALIRVEGNCLEFEYDNSQEVRCVTPPYVVRGGIS
ncbi:hypothetical protein BGZ70_002799 [Mortierella alpina]|uniref:Uncharacterized protein n=1 Tax=Mortierella alpina TaxID=64518 RepID=A0A9P6IU27_MORAP|nr:hypothetical protein BGZ70_002799 [Mortierella alpina]